MLEQLQAWAKERGYKVAWGPVALIEDARREVLARRDVGELDDGFFRAELEPLTRDFVSRVGETVVVVAKPAPAHEVHFELDGERVDAILPPTYVRYRPTFEEVRLDLVANGLPGVRVEHFSWPIKAVAARLGLVRYGRNNITYAPDLGSYVQLCGYITDAPLPTGGDGAHRAPMLLDECATCGACVSACPTGAIDEDHTLLRAERCLTFANENAGEWPAWLPKWSHHTLLGCLLCQQACPVNPKLTVADTGVTFSAEESAGLLADAARAASRPETGIRAKLAWLGQPYAEPVLGRNLRALLDARRSVRG